MNRNFLICLTVVVVNRLLISTGALAAPAQTTGQSNGVIVGNPIDYNAAIHSFMVRKDLAGLEQFGRQSYSDWVRADPGTYSHLMLKVANAFAAFPIASDSAKSLAIEFLELSVRRTSELEIQEELFLVARRRQDWDRLAKIMPAEVVAMREGYADRMLTAWQRAEGAWEQIKDRPVIVPMSSDVEASPLAFYSLDKSGNRVKAPTPGPATFNPEPPIMAEIRLRSSPEVAREYNFRLGLQNEMVNYTNVVAGNLAAAFSQVPQDFGRLAALTEQLLKKPESRDAFYAVAARGLPAHLVPQFQAVAREMQERRKAHQRTPSAPLIREHTNRPFASPAARGSNPVPNQTVGKPVPAVKTPIIAAAAPDAATSVPPESNNTPIFLVTIAVAVGLVSWLLLRTGSSATRQ